MDTVPFCSVDSRLFSSFGSCSFIVLSFFLSLIAAEEECKAYYDLNGRVRLLDSNDRLLWLFSILSCVRRSVTFKIVLRTHIMKFYTIFRVFTTVSHAQFIVVAMLLWNIVVMIQRKEILLSIMILFQCRKFHFISLAASCWHRILYDSLTNKSNINWNMYQWEEILWQTANLTFS